MGDENLVEKVMLTGENALRFSDALRDYEAQKRSPPGTVLVGEPFYTERGGIGAKVYVYAVCSSTLVVSMYEEGSVSLEFGGSAIHRTYAKGQLTRRVGVALP